MNLSPRALLQDLAPWMLAGAAVTLALVLAVLVALFGVAYFLLRFRRHGENASGAGGIGGFTWTSAHDSARDPAHDSAQGDDRRAGRSPAAETAKK